MIRFNQSTVRPLVIASTLGVLASNAIVDEFGYGVLRSSAKSFLSGDFEGNSRKSYRVSLVSSNFIVTTSRVASEADRRRNILLEKYAGRLSQKDEEVVRSLMGMLSAASGDPSKQLIYDSYGV